MTSNICLKQETAQGLTAKLLVQLVEFITAPKDSKVVPPTAKQLQAAASVVRVAPTEEVRQIKALMARVVSDMESGRERGPFSVVRTVSEASPSEDTLAFMDKLRKEGENALARRITLSEVITSKELQQRLKISRQAISEAVKMGRLFGIEGPKGVNYYPAFYADRTLDRKAIEKVSKVLGAIPSTSKYRFFTSESTFLGDTPLAALRNGRVADVLAAAAGFAER